MGMVTGPSLTRCTCMFAPNSPVTGPSTSTRACATRCTSASISGVAAHADRLLAGRQQLDRDPQPAHRVDQAVLDLGAVTGCARQGPVPRHMHVQLAELGA